MVEHSQARDRKRYNIGASRYKGVQEHELKEQKETRVLNRGRHEWLVDQIYHIHKS